MSAETSLTLLPFFSLRFPLSPLFWFIFGQLNCSTKRQAWTDSKSCTQYNNNNNNRIATNKMQAHISRSPVHLPECYLCICLKAEFAKVVSSCVRTSLPERRKSKVIWQVCGDRQETSFHNEHESRPWKNSFQPLSQHQKHICTKHNELPLPEYHISSKLHISHTVRLLRKSLYQLHRVPAMHRLSLQRAPFAPIQIQHPHMFISSSQIAHATKKSCTGKSHYQADLSPKI